MQILIFDLKASRYIVSADSAKKSENSEMPIREPLMKKILLVIAFISIIHNPLEAAKDKPNSKSEKPLLEPQRYYIDFRVGMDYYYVNSGYLLPSNNAISLTSEPYYYYKLQTGIDFNIFGFSFLLKNNFNAPLYQDDYINRSETIQRNEDYETTERIFSALGYLTPFQMSLFSNSKYYTGLYVDSSMKTFQTRLKTKEPIIYQSHGRKNYT